MSLNLKALALTTGIVWGGCFFCTALLNQLWPPYGAAWLALGQAIYPGYHGPAGFGSVIVVTLYALVDGAVAGFVFGWLYNRFAGSRG
jgi:hypothetical protein